MTGPLAGRATPVLPRVSRARRLAHLTVPVRAVTASAGLLEVYLIPHNLS